MLNNAFRNQFNWIFSCNICQELLLSFWQQLSFYRVFVWISFGWMWVEFVQIETIGSLFYPWLRGLKSFFQYNLWIFWKTKWFYKRLHLQLLLNHKHIFLKNCIVQQNLEEVKAIYIEMNKFKYLMDSMNKYNNADIKFNEESLSSWISEIVHLPKTT